MFITFHLKNQRIIMAPFYLFLIFHLLSTVAPADDSTLPNYKPYENIAIDCGSSGSIRQFGVDRLWEGDNNSKFFPSQNQNTESTTSTPSVPFTEGDSIPHRTARLSRSDFTYTFPVTPGQKFIRFHFYPAVYGDFNTANAFFSVKTSRFTLLSNFSAFLTARALQTQSLVKEYCLNVDQGEVLNITFGPVLSSNSSDSFAFINGIEVVSMPTNLYYSADENRDAAFVEQGSFYPIGNETAVEMEYRINVGGAFISPSGDTGMYRTWDTEYDYLRFPGYSVLPLQINGGLNFTMIPNYTAPASVYETGRSTGNIKDKALLQSYNLTWEFPVDSGFYYLVRLHFCELLPQMNRSGDRVFYIYIANQTAENRADIIAWSGAIYTPIYRDYVIGMFGQGIGKKVNLSIALHVNPEEWRTQYLDALLNGIEMFKLNNSVGSLAGPNPDPLIDSPKFGPPSTKQSKGKSNQTVIIGIVCGVVSVGLVLSMIGFLIFRRQRKIKSSSSVDGKFSWGPASFSANKSSETRASMLPSDVCRYFSLAEIKAATNDFDDMFIIGRGGFGNVYKGYIDSGTIAVAIKRLKPESSQGAHEFKTEIEMLSQLRHLHLVSLIGYCNEDREMILVYEHMARGTLREHLYNSDNPQLSWKKRLEICIGAARGLHYLHTGAKHTIIHRDVKTTNILLDEKWIAKVSDFGLSKEGPTNMANAHISTVVKGSLGYLDPEYYRRQQLTEKSDVYSFGVVLCEVLCARPPIVRSVEKREISLSEWARNCYRNGTFHEIVDKHMRGKIAPECLNKYGEIAVSCLVDNGNERPSMNDVVWGLEFALQLQESAEENLSVSESEGVKSEKKGENEVALVNYSEDDGKFSCSWEDSLEQRSSGGTKPSSSEQSSETNQSIKGLSGFVFSEINNPQAR